jgi:opacity protein-like surface antigen
MRNIISFRNMGILFIAMLLSTTVSAQLSSPIKIYAGGGVSDQQKPAVFNDWYKSGWNLTAGVGYDIMPMVELVGNSEYHSFPNDFSSDPERVVGGGNIRAAMFGLQTRVTPSLPMIPVKPYGLIGVGMAKVSQSDQVWWPGAKVGTIEWQRVTAGVEDQTKFYYCFGGGVMYSPRPKVSLFVEARHTTIQVESVNSLYDSPFRFWAMTAGVRLL